MELKRRIKRTIIDSIKTLKLYRFYNLTNTRAKNVTPLIVCMLDGRMLHGGISDRLWGILSTYKYCKMHGIDYKINFKSPYDLRLFFQFNEIDWSINESQLSYNLKDAHPRYISQFSHDVEIMLQHASSILDSNKRQQHIYSNMRMFPNDEFQQLFNELFRLSPLLENAIATQKARIGSDYISVTFRFQQLLGDFKEGNFPIISSENERMALINRCKSIIKRLRETHNGPILVTSDSCKFLNEVLSIDNVFIIPGKVIHVDFNASKEDVNAHLKSFVDLFMIAGASKIYQGLFPPLYKSLFPVTAAALGGKKCEIIPFFS